MGKAISRRGLRLAAVVAVVLGAAGGIAYATIPDNGKVFTACVLNKVGTIRLIDTALPASNLMSHCTTLETQVNWNQLGPPGVPGTNGAAGELRGPAGPRGTCKAGRRERRRRQERHRREGRRQRHRRPEPAGTNCAAGARRSRRRTRTYACNGANGTGGGGPTGQAGYGTTAGVAAATVTNFTFVDVPGLSLAFDVPANSVAYVSTDGGPASRSPQPSRAPARSSTSRSNLRRAGGVRAGRRLRQRCGVAVSAGELEPVPSDPAFRRAPHDQVVAVSPAASTLRAAPRSAVGTAPSTRGLSTLSSSARDPLTRPLQRQRRLELD